MLKHYHCCWFSPLWAHGTLLILAFLSSFETHIFSKFLEFIFIVQFICKRFICKNLVHCIEFYREYRKPFSHVKPQFAIVLCKCKKGKKRPLVKKMLEICQLFLKRVLYLCPLKCLNLLKTFKHVKGCSLVQQYNNSVKSQIS